MATEVTRAQIVTAARAWIGTPYHHQAALRGGGCDCLGLIRGVWRDIYGDDPETPPPYTSDWGEIGTIEHLLQAAGRHLIPVAGAPRPGDVLVFRMRAGAMAKHLAILSGDWAMVHAQSDDAVREVTFAPYWRRHVVAAFSFPGVVD